MARFSKSDPAADLKRLDDERSEANAALAQLVAERTALVLAGEPEEIIDNDRRQILQLAKIEQYDARLSKVREQLRAAEAEAAAITLRKAYEAAVAARKVGVQALADINGHLAQIADARTRLIKSKGVVAAANLSLPPGCSPIADPEGGAIERGWPSILDQILIPLTGIA